MHVHDITKAGTKYAVMLFYKNGSFVYGFWDRWSEVEACFQAATQRLAFGIWWGPDQKIQPDDPEPEPQWHTWFINVDERMQAMIDADKRENRTRDIAFMASHLAAGLFAAGLFADRPDRVRDVTWCVKSAEAILMRAENNTQEETG